MNDNSASSFNRIYFAPIPSYIELHSKANLSKKIQKHFNGKEKFTFREFHVYKILKIIKELPKNKASFFFKNIPVKIMVNWIHIYCI